MIEAQAFLEPALARGFSAFTGVPCSFLTPFINRVISDPRFAYVGATSEGEAVGIAAGAWLAGKRSVVMCQNSGLGNTVNPLTSLCWPFRMPLLLVVTWRGQPGVKDEPQHALMGRVSRDLLGLMEIGHRLFPKRDEEIGEALDAVDAWHEAHALPFALVMEKGAVRDAPLAQAPPEPRPQAAPLHRRTGASPPRRVEVLERVLASVPGEAALIATTGKTGRELFTLADRPQHFYQVGSMGCASAIGLGVALNTAHPVVVLDGDGAALMKLGNMATIGAHAPANLVHVILDNGAHDSTGGQATVSPHVDFAVLASAAGYARATSVDSLALFDDALGEALAAPGPALVHVRIRPGAIPGLGRPTVSPAEVARRFRAFLAETRHEAREAPARAGAPAHP